MVASAILLTLAAVVCRFFYNSLGWQARNLRRTNLQQQMTLALQRVSSDLQQSAPVGVTIGSNRVAVQKIADASTDIPPQLIWETALTTYFVTADGLYRRVWPPAPPDLGVTLTTALPFRPDPSQLTALCISQRSVLIGRNVTTLEVSNPNTLPLRLTVRVAEDQESFASTRVLSLRNAE